MLPSKTTSRSSVTDSDDPARAAGHLARAICMALTPQLDKLKDADLTPLAVRVNLDPESVSILLMLLFSRLGFKNC